MPMIRHKKALTLSVTSVFVASLLALILALTGCQSRFNDEQPRSTADALVGVQQTDTDSALGSGAGDDVPATDAAAFDYETMVDPSRTLESQEINGGMPFFSKDELTLDAREEYAPLDALGRCGAAMILAGPETVPTSPRPDISSILPTGWVQARYDFITQSNGALYNRSHLAARSLGGADEQRNLITGTTHFNQELMDDYEEQARAQIKAGRHLLWRVTPVFVDDELVARGVLIEGCTVEDSGDSLTLCVWCPNAQPGVEIDYTTGESRAVGSDAKTADSVDSSSATSQPRYVLNTRSKVYHLADASCANSIADHNRRESNEKATVLEAQGYRPCGSCHPDRVD